MGKKDIEKAIEKLLKGSKKPLDQSEISKKTGFNFWDVCEVTDKFERQGLITS